jgi:hypothetical protein
MLAKTSLAQRLRHACASGLFLSRADPLGGLFLTVLGEPLRRGHDGWEEEERGQLPDR